MFEKLKKIDPDKISSNVLAYIGDSVFELYSRLHVLDNCNGNTSSLHCKNIAYVNASSQANATRRILPQLSEEELRIFKRGRNTKSGTMAKNANAVDYRVATGIEALIGYLYLKEENIRVEQILNLLITGEDIK